MPKAFTGSFANSLDRVSELEIKEAEDGDMVESGKALLAQDAHMILKTNGSSYQAQLDTGELVNRHGLLSMSSFDRLPLSRVLPQSE